MIRRIRWPSAALPLLPLLAFAGGAGAQEADKVPLGLLEAEVLAREGNPSLRAARLDAEAAERGAAAAGAFRWPGLAAMAGVLGTDDPVGVFGAKLRQERFGTADLDVARLNDPASVSDWSAGVGASWSVADPSRWAGLAAARSDARAAGAAAARTDEAVRFGTRVLYLDAVRGRSRSAAARSAETAAGATLARVTRRRDEGMATDADVLLAEAALAEAVARRVHAEAAAADAADALGAHLGWPAGRVPVPTDTLPDIPLPDDDRPGPDGRSDLRASEASVDAARGRARQASAGRLPTLEGFAQWSTHAPGLADDRGAHWTAGLRLSVPVFTGFALEASADAARAGARAAEARHDERVRAARLEVERARRGVEAARRALDAAASGGGAAREAARLLRRRYEEGMTTLADLLQAEAGAARLEAAWVDARADLGVAAAALAFALGSPGDPPPTDAATDLPSDPNSREDAR